MLFNLLGVKIKKNNMQTKFNNSKSPIRCRVSMSNLVKAHDKYQSEIINLEKKLVDFIDFEFSIIYQYSDGFVLLHVENAHNAPLSDCISIIEEKGFLNYGDYIKLCI